MPDPARKIVQARVTMLFDQPFFGHLAIGLEPIEKRNMFMPTMATDGRKLYYDPDFVNNMSSDELQAVIIHEVLHCALNHISRRQGRDARWQFATDFAVNDIVVANFRLPPGCLVPGEIPGTDDFKGKHAEYIYGKLPEPIYISVEWQTVDSHEEWGNWEKSGEGEEGKGEKGESQDGKGEGKADGTEVQKDDGEGLEEQWRERVAQAATSARMAGKLPGHLEELIGTLLQPKLDWRHILRDMITSCAKNDFRIIPPNKRHLWRNIYLPGMIGEQINIAVAIDTSGSISAHEMREFLSEVKGICDTYTDYTIHLLACDVKIHQKWELHPFDPLPTVLEGRGGTSFKEPMVEADSLVGITSLVYLTDLYPNDGFPDEPFTPVIWVSVSEVEPPYGYLIKLPRED